jgi:hypothetical protein
MPDTTITVLPDKWLTTAETAQALRKSERTVQKMAKAGKLKWRLASRPDQPSARVYDPEDVQRFVPTEPRSERARSHRAKAGPTGDVATPQTALATRTPRAVVDGHEMETLNLVGKMLIEQRAEREIFANTFERTLSSIAGMILNHQKAEADANRERLKAEREDARERWELERKDRAARWQVKSESRGKAKSARA